MDVRHYIELRKAELEREIDRLAIAGDMRSMMDRLDARCRLAEINQLSRQLAVEELMQEAEA